MTNELAIRKDTQIISTFQDAQSAAVAMSKSGFFQDSREASQALVKILAGRELGFGPFASMQGVFIIQGRPSIGANLMASAVKGSEKYDYRVKTNTDVLCEIEFFENGKSIGVSKFSIEDARKAQTKNLDKFPRNMLFARAISNGVRWYCPDAFNGNAVYTPEELGADVDVEGNVIPGSFQEVTQNIVPETKTSIPENIEQADQLPFDAPLPSMSLEFAENEKSSKGERYGDIDTPQLLNMSNAMLRLKKTTPDKFTDEHVRKLDAIQVILKSRKTTA